MPTPAKRPPRAKTLSADCSGSECFDALTYKAGTVTASFIGPSSGEWTFDMSLKEAREWFNSEDGLGEFFNENVR